MKDRWMNIGCEDDELKPHREPNKAIEEKRIGMNLCGFPEHSPAGVNTLVKSHDWAPIAA
jgi:hypothetical protein